MPSRRAVKLPGLRPMMTLTICRHHCAAVALREAGRQTPLHALYLVDHLSRIQFDAMILAQPRRCWTWASGWRSSRPRMLILVSRTAREQP